jgi:uncharacterized protein (TIRG00374 family)
VEFWFSKVDDRGSLSKAIKPARRISLETVAGYMLAFVCLFWVFRHLDLAELLRRVVHMKLAWVGAAVFSITLSYLCQGARWQLLLSPLAPVTVMRATQAIYAGLFVNEVLPLRLGEIVRAVLISRWTSLKLSSIVASILIERLCDGLWLAAGVVLVTVLVPLPRRLIEAGDVFWIVIFVAILAFTWVVFSANAWSNTTALVQTEADRDRKQLTVSSRPRRLAHAVTLFMRGALGDLRMVGYTNNALLACILSLIMLLLQALALWFAMRAYGLHVSIPASLAVFIIVHLGTMVPAAPGNVGTYQFFIVLGLTLLASTKPRRRFLISCVRSAKHTAGRSRLLGFWH